MAIPKESTPIKNEILVEIFAKRKLALRELSIVSYIIRHSWGYDDKKNKRRQDWTKPMTITEIAENINMDRGNTSKIINDMLRRNILCCQEDRYQFNEHSESWSVLNQHSVSKQHGKRVKSTRSACQNNTPIPTKSMKTKGDKIPKETLKETYKENINICVFHSLVHLWNSLSEVPQLRMIKSSAIYQEGKRRLLNLLEKERRTIIEIRQACKNLNEYLEKPNKTWPSNPPTLPAFLRPGYIEKFYQDIPHVQDEMKNRFIGIGKPIKRYPTKKDVEFEKLRMEYPTKKCQDILFLWRDGYYNNRQRDEELKKATKKKRHG